MTRELVEALPEKAPEWVREAFAQVNAGTPINVAARQQGRNPQSLRRWIIAGEAERKAQHVARWRERNPDRARELGVTSKRAHRERQRLAQDDGRE